MKNRKLLTSKKNAIPLSAGMVFVTIGLVYGDIGTSPLYTLKAIIAGNGGLNTMSTDVVVGAISLIIWTITIITTVKYVLVVLKADNNNEGGIFSLFYLVRDYGKYLMIPAIVGGAALLADSVLTPAVTITSAVEGLRTFTFFDIFFVDHPEIIIGIVLVILIALFGFQHSGSATVGRFFAPVMVIWFSALAILGLYNIYIWGDFQILRAFNPLEGIHFLFSDINAMGIFVLGNVFLCTTGVEALYSDIGHVGKKNIYATWPFIKIALIINYLGQGCWIIANSQNPTYQNMDNLNPFFELPPDILVPFFVVLATLAAIIASQALITGAFSILSEAIRLHFFPQMETIFPSAEKGQIYLPFANFLLFSGTVLVVLIFQKSIYMEAAYGLAITVTMLMTTALLFVYFYKIKKQLVFAILALVVFGTIEFFFFVSSLAKFTHGGWFTIVIASFIIFIMLSWYFGDQVEKRHTSFLPTKYCTNLFEQLRKDDRVPLVAQNLVFLSSSNQDLKKHFDRDVMYSIMDRGPKKAEAYYFAHLVITDNPFGCSYTVENIYNNYIFKVNLYLGFKVKPMIYVFMNQIISDLISSGELDKQGTVYKTDYRFSNVGSMRFCSLRKVTVSDSGFSPTETFLLEIKRDLRNIFGDPKRWFGVEVPLMITETVPIYSNNKEVAITQEIPIIKREDL